VKSYRKSLSDANNYRGISLIPIVTKLLETVILQKCPILAEAYNTQYGFKNMSSTLHAEFIVQETIKHYNNKGSPVYICSLDAEKAFDSCNWSSLFTKLSIDKQLPSAVIKILHSLYQNGCACVIYLGEKSNVFKLTQGVRQGSILSPYLYNIYTEQLLRNINKMNIGTIVGRTHTAITSYADDIILISATCSGLQSLINECVKYGKKNLIKFNPLKTEFIISGKPNFKNSCIKIDGNVIKPKNSLTHLGFHWNVKCNHIADIQLSHTNHRITEFLAASNALISSGIRFCHPNTIKTLFNSLLIPRLTYGLELCQLSKSHIESLQCKAKISIKSLFNISKYSRNLLHHALGIRHLRDVLYKNKLNTYIRLLNNQDTRNILFHQLSHTRVSASFTSDVLDICESCDISIIDITIKRKIPKMAILSPEPNQQASAVITELKCLLKSWYLYESRKRFMEIMELNIIREN
jgi:hypothetical protein